MIDNLAEFSDKPHADLAVPVTCAPFLARRRAVHCCDDIATLPLLLPFFGGFSLFLL